MAMYDCVTFFNELELLDIRLSLLNDVVDYFVIVEMNQTHRGKRKEWIFENNKERYSKYKNKIIYVQVDDPPKYNPNLLIDRGDGTKNGDWSLENYQRNAIMRGLMNCSPNDIILISDIDEIPNPVVLNNILNEKLSFSGIKKISIRLKWKCILKYITSNPFVYLKSLEVKDIVDKKPILFENVCYYYYLNGKTNVYDYTTILCKYKNISTPQNLRNSKYTLPIIRNAGWHFSYLGGIKRIKKKLLSIVEGNPNKSDEKYLSDCLEHGKDIYGRKYHGKEYLHINYVCKNEIGLPNINDIINKYPYLYKGKKL